MPSTSPLFGQVFLSCNRVTHRAVALVDHGQRQRELILLSDGSHNGNGKPNAVMPEPAGTIESSRRDRCRHRGFAALSGSAAALVGLGRLGTTSPHRTCGFRERRWSSTPAALHRGLTPMSYCRDGHREPPDPQPTSSSTSDKPLRLSVDIHLIRHHTVRLSDSFARRR